jgi:peroxiredoxin Q/BCP
MTLKSWLKVGLTVVLGVAAGTNGRAQSAAELKPGDAAPNFSLPGSDGKTHTLAEHKGKRAVVLAWFPKAFTGG